MIENADFLGQPQRRVEREEINERPEPDAPGRARHGAEIDARHRHQVERRRVMLGHMQAVESGLLGGDGEGQALIERGRDRAVRAFDVIEESDLHVDRR
jgi:hypothetical protein